MLNITISIKLLLAIVYFGIGLSMSIWGLKYRYRWGFYETFKTFSYAIGLSILIILFWLPLSIYNALK